MAETRRAAEVSKALLIEAAAQIINDEGYAALSARALAEKVGLKRQIVHYYFRTMEDLLLAVVRHYGDESVERLPPTIDPEYATFLISSISQTLVQEELIGVQAGHDKFRAIVEQALEEFSATGKSSYFQ